MTILALAARVDLLGPVVLRVQQAPLDPVVPPPVLVVPQVAEVGALDLLEQEALAAQRVLQVLQVLGLVAAVRSMPALTRPTHPTHPSDLDGQTGFAADGGGDPMGFTGAHLRSGDVSGQGISSYIRARLNIWK